jgi:DNA helicase-2/ATP-dependent DNA helicase PcrA
VFRSTASNNLNIPVVSAPGIKKPSAATPSGSFKTGDKVSHKTFGSGMILSVTPMGNDTLLEIAFDKVGTKKLFQNFAKLTKE